jgi:hypothetical protein
MQWRCGDGREVAGRVTALLRVRRKGGMMRSEVSRARREPREVAVGVSNTVAQASHRHEPRTKG